MIVFILGVFVGAAQGWGGTGNTVKECYNNWMICRLSQKVGSVYEGNK